MSDQSEHETIKARALAALAQAKALQCEYFSRRAELNGLRQKEARTRRLLSFIKG